MFYPMQLYDAGVLRGQCVLAALIRPHSLLPTTNYIKQDSETLESYRIFDP